jgi:hypothetical protein
MPSRTNAVTRDPEHERPDEKQGRFGDNPARGLERQRHARIGRRDHTAHDRQDHEAQHVVDDGSAQDYASLTRLALAEVAQHAGRNPHTRRRQRRAEERVDVRAAVGQEQRPHPPPQRERRDHSKHGNQECGTAHFHHVAHGGLEPHLEQQQNHPELRERIDDGVGFQRVETVDPGQTEIAEHDAGDELAQHGRLSDARRDVASHFRAGENHDEREENRCEAAVRGGRHDQRTAHRPSIPRACAASHAPAVIRSIVTR